MGGRRSPERPEYYSSYAPRQHHEPPPTGLEQYQAKRPRIDVPPEPYQPATQFQPHREYATSSPAWSPYGDARQTPERSTHHYNQELPYRHPSVSHEAHSAKVAIPSTPESLRAPPRLKVETTVTPRHPGPVEAGSSRDAGSRRDAGPPAREAAQMNHNPVLATQLPGEYTIHMRQQPRAARACGFGDRDRRCIDPPPIIQLTINNPEITAEELRGRLHYPFYVVHCSLYDKTGEIDCTYMPEGFPRQKRMMGNIASGPFVAKDEFGDEGCFFPFPDMSIRTPGEYRLKFSFVIIEPQSGTPGRNYSINSFVYSNVFLVSSAKEFPGMVESSPLARTLKDQGYLISIRKGGDSRKGRGGRRKKADDSSDESDDSAPSPPRRKRKSVQ